MSTSHAIPVAFQHPANTPILAYLGRSGEGSILPNGSPQEHPDPYYGLGTHPELVARLWDELPVFLPEKCQWIINGKPVLVHPSSGIIFGYAEGTHAYALRLPPIVYEKALQSGATRAYVYPDSLVDLDPTGKEWLFCGWFRGEEGWCLSAYEFAGSIGLR
jgi:hypothetical protein